MNNQPLIQPLLPGQKKKKRQNSRSKFEHCHGPHGQDNWLLKISKWEKKKSDI